MAKAQKGDFEPGHWPFQRRHDDQDSGADRCIGQSRALSAYARHRFDTVGVAPLIEGVEFGAFLADKAFDSNGIIADLDDRGAVVATELREPIVGG